MKNSRPKKILVERCTDCLRSVLDDPTMRLKRVDDVFVCHPCAVMRRFDHMEQRFDDLFRKIDALIDDDGSYL